MKKLTLAVAIAAVSSTAVNAATIYDDKGLTYKVKGDWQVQLRDSHKKAEDMDVEFDDLEIKNSVVYDLGNGVKALGQLDFGFKDAAEDDGDAAALEEAYLGVQYDNFKVTVGKQNTATDEFGVEGAYETELAEDTFDEFATSGDDVIKVEAEFGPATVIVSHDLEAEGNDSENGEATDLFVAADFDAVSLAAAYQTFTGAPGEEDATSWGVSASFDAGFATIGVDYSSTEDDENVEEIEVTNVVASFKASKTTKVNVGYVNLDSDTEVNFDSADTFYANVTYKFPSQKNVSMFAEISKSDYDNAAEDANHETDILAGLRIKF